MAKLEIEVAEDGSFGTLPEDLQKFLDKRINQAKSQGAKEAAEQAKAQIEAEAKKAREEALQQAKQELGGSVTEAEREKLKSIEAELSKLREKEAEKDKDYEKAKQEREERYARELKERESRFTQAQKDIERHMDRIRTMATKDITVAASQMGVREESLTELEVILSRRIAVNPETLEAFVTDANDPTQAAVGDDDAPISVFDLVAQYVADHPHHKSPTPGKPGGARGGSSLTGKKQTAEEAEREAAFAAVEAQPSVTNIAAALKVAGKRAS